MHNQTRKQNSLNLQIKTAMDIVTRLKLFMDNSEISISQFADTCHIPRPTMSQLLNGRNKKVSDELITKIHQAYPSLSVLWLMFGEGEMFVNGNNEFSEPKNSEKSTYACAQHSESNHVCNATATINDSSNKLHQKEEIEMPMRFSEISHNISSQFGYAAVPESSNGLIDFEHDYSTGNIMEEQSLNNEKETFSSTKSDTIKQNLSGKQPDISSIHQQSDPEDLNDMNPKAAPEQLDANEISLHTNPDKRITNIVVFYSDNSFQSFIPANQE